MNRNKHPLPASPGGLLIGVLALVNLSGSPLQAAELPTQSQDSNLIANGGFEGAGTAPWQIAPEPGASGFCVDSSNPHSGHSCLKAVASPKAQSIRSPPILTDICTLYTLSLWIKTDGVSKPNGVGVKILQRNSGTGWSCYYPTTAKADQSAEPNLGEAGGTQDWKHYRFMPDPAADSIELCLKLEEGMTGTAWFDDVTLGSVSKCVAQSDFTGQWHNVKKWGEQVRWVENSGAVDNLEITLQQGSYTLWLSQLGDGHPDIEVGMNGKTLGCGSGGAATGWRKIGTASVSSGRHHFTLTCKDPKRLNNKAAYAGMIISTNPNPALPDFNSRFNVPLETLPVTLYPSKPTDSRMVMVFASVLCDVNYPMAKAVGFPYAGASLVASIAHRYKIPVTWMSSNQAAVKMKSLLAKWHEEYGDDVTCMDWNNSAGLKAVLPWANTTVAAPGGGRNVAGMEKAGVQGAWGWCWEQVGIDNISDRGCPWAPFYVSRQNPKMTANYEGKVIAFDWTTRDLNKALHIHAGEPCRFSSDPDDPRTGRILYGRAIEYWKQLLNEYQRNTDWNDQVPFVFQQESHEMEWSFGWNGNSEADKLKGNSVITLNVKALDEFFKYARSKNVTFMTQPQFIQMFRNKSPGVTPAHYMLFRDIPTQEPVSYGSPGAPITKGPYPLTFLYCGPDCQLAFEDGQREPKMAYNYQRDPKEFSAEKCIPQVTSFAKSKSGDGEVWNITVSNPNPYDFPMGITEWGDFSSRTVTGHSTTIKECKTIGKTLVFIRCTAQAGATSTFKIKLSR